MKGRATATHQCKKFIRKGEIVMKTNLTEKIEHNEKKLIELRTKRDNLEREISNLERKLYNQKHALRNISVEKRPE
jgi:cell division protein FtsB